MSKPNTLSLGLRLLGLAAALAVCWIAIHPGPAAAFPSSGCEGPGVTTYYSDASHSTVVGSCGGGCCTACSCTGSTSAFYTHQMVFCLDVICPSSS